jgi:S-adenosylmethionine:tRNA ribosyltransferase-isomerase
METVYSFKMKTSDFNFDLPEELIAQYPPEKRGQSRLMLLNHQTGKRSHSMVENLPEILCGLEFKGKDSGPPLLVFNNSKVRKARLMGKALSSGAEVEFLLVEKIGAREWKALVKRAKRRKPGSFYTFHDKQGAEIARSEITGEEGDFKYLAFDRVIDDDWLDLYGHIPLPPYIKRQDAPSDSERYQTVYANAYGSSAAPTAGLHFTNDLLTRVYNAGIESVFITLHVGLGTFLPVRSENIEDHVMHREVFSIDEQAASKIEAAKVSGRKVIAVGTTSARTLESAWEKGAIKRGEGSTSIFIYPGYTFNVVDALFTNFHTPESTLLMLVSAFAGRDLILESYAEAITEGYRFFSYGDAMLIL